MRQAVERPLCRPPRQAHLPADRAPRVPLGAQVAILAASTATRGRPSSRPFALAFLMPARTRSQIRLHSSSATAPSTVNTIFSVGVLAPRASNPR